ncbi:L-threonylcarbamoyladenylate synthase [Novosphingobium chloroacetimidivorans]|uniref:Threonylcarbamoyl-AMP synthase n=1 Tax=Novosphingobium chloroacetimidivorans TaxID=1428314 RepID=A0A7W7K8X1_9SPHN|nr:L-threonylcarbamoyladenylate synthase [Novosphingobium chloroacetimidivorans]MBB4857874.1 L-threonylcarbamoyladenylate synthase [Novosphingobium chloroacetimidivorans]
MTPASRSPILAADADGIRRAARQLRDGGLAALPTETVYGLAARADTDASVAAIYRAKGRPSFNPLIVHVGSTQQAEDLAHFDERARALASAFWPGPLTLVLPLREGARLAKAVTAGLPTVALRCPAHPVMRAVLEQAGVPVAAPSANRSGAVSPTTAEHVATSLAGAVDLILDAGPCAAGVESTIVALRSGGWEILRPGPVTENHLAAVLGVAPLASGGRHGIEAPGQLASHYAPGKPVRLEATWADPDEFLIGFGDVAGHLSMSARGDLEEAASRLYAVLHEAASAVQPRIAVAPIPKSGVGSAINDRLRRAAA